MSVENSNLFADLWYMRGLHVKQCNVQTGKQSRAVEVLLYAGLSNIISNPQHALTSTHVLCAIDKRITKYLPWTGDKQHEVHFFSSSYHSSNILHNATRVLHPIKTRLLFGIWTIDFDVLCNERLLCLVEIARIYFALWCEWLRNRASLYQ